MPITAATLRSLRRAKVDLNAIVDQAERDLVAAWAAAWDDLTGQWELAIADLVAMTVDGAWPPAWRIARAERVLQALAATQAALDDLAAQTGTTITTSLPGLTGQAAEWEARLIATQMPHQAGSVAALTVRFDRLDRAALDWVVARTTEQVNARLWPLTADATTAMNTALIRGVAVGENPRRMASLMTKMVEGAFNGGLTRALNLARTEMLDAHRNATYGQRLANAGILQGWEWCAELGPRTCASCLAKHGTRYPAEVPGPEDHQQGRCVAVPVTLSWRDMGYDLDEPASPMPDARAWFDSQPEAVQLKIMGPARLDLLQSGRIGWEDLSTLRTTPEWRDSWGVTSVQELLAIAGGEP